MKEEERPMAANTVSITFGSFDPVQVPKRQVAREGKIKFQIISAGDRKVCNMVEEGKKQRSNGGGGAKYQIRTEI